MNSFPSRFFLVHDRQSHEGPHLRVFARPGMAQIMTRERVDPVGRRSRSDEAHAPVFIAHDSACCRARASALETNFVLTSNIVATAGYSLQLDDSSTRSSVENSCNQPRASCVSLSII